MKTELIAVVVETDKRRLELRKQLERNRNYFVRKFFKIRGEWKQGDDPEDLFTVYTKDKRCKRGEYAEEFDVLCYSKSVTEAKKVAQWCIEHAGYEQDLRPVKAVWRPAGFLFT